MPSFPDAPEGGTEAATHVGGSSAGWSWGGYEVGYSVWGLLPALTPPGAISRCSAWHSISQRQPEPRWCCSTFAFPAAGAPPLMGAAPCELPNRSFLAEFTSRLRAVLSMPAWQPGQRGRTGSGRRRTLQTLQSLPRSFSAAPKPSRAALLANTHTHTAAPLREGYRNQRL